jgi:hypothetical protein
VGPLAIYREGICVGNYVTLGSPLLVLGGFTGLFWTAAYLLIVARARRDKIYGMPVVALCGNLSWEIINSFTAPPLGSVRPFPVVWLSIDAVIAWQAVKYGPAQFPRLSKRVCYGFFGLTLLFTFVATFELNKVFADYYRDHWGLYGAFVANVLMAALFLYMFYSRGSSAGQSVPIAVCMLLGNGSAGIAWLLFPPPEVIASTFQACLIGGALILNLLYVVVLLRSSGSRHNPHIGAAVCRQADSPRA